MCTFTRIEGRPFFGVGFKLEDRDVLAPLDIHGMDRWVCSSDAPTTGCVCGEQFCPWHAQLHQDDICVPDPQRLTLGQVPA